MQVIRMTMEFASGWEESHKTTTKQQRWNKHDPSLVAVSLKLRFQFSKAHPFYKKRRTFVIFLLFLCVHTVVIVLPTFPSTLFFRQKTNIFVIFCFLKGNFPIGQQHSCEKRSLYVLLIDVNLAEMLKISLFFSCVYTFYVKRRLSLTHQIAIEFESWFSNEWENLCCAKLCVVLRENVGHILQ